MRLHIRSDRIKQCYIDELTNNRLYAVYTNCEYIANGVIFGVQIKKDSGVLDHIHLSSSSFLVGSSRWILCDENGLEVENSGWTEERLREVSERIP